MKVLLSCGEPSGDSYAGALTRELLSLEPSSQVFGMGGDQLRAEGGEVVEDYRGLTVTGLSEAIGKLPRSWATYRRLVALARRERPDVFVPIDFPDFNFFVASSLNRLGIPVVYYVCPQVWAWRRRRLRSIKRFTTRALVIFPFEEAIYQDANIPVEFVGHPLVDLLPQSGPGHAWHRSHGLDPTSPTVALLPGSRPNEIRAILPVLVDAMPLIQQRVQGTQFVVARAPHLDDELFSCLSDRPSDGLLPGPIVVESQTDDALTAADVVVTASGTATVQTALHERPMVIVYRLSPVTYRLVKTFAHVESAGMVNLIAGEKIVPELLQEALTPQAVADAVVRFLTDSQHAETTRTALAGVRSRLGPPGASRRAAEAILCVGRGPRSR